jgi:hypothetical protein
MNTTMIHEMLPQMTDTMIHEALPQMNATDYMGKIKKSSANHYCHAPRNVSKLPETRPQMLHDH